MSAVWPPGFVRVPDEEWTRAPVASLAQKYDAVGKHGWYENLDPTVRDVAEFLREGHVVVDYSGGTGLFIERLLAARPSLAFGIVDVDSSPKFLAMALAKLRDEPRVAFRLLGYLKDERRLQSLDEVLDAPLRERGLDAVVSTNAVHLYRDLVPTLASWARLLRPDGRVFVQSGNIRNPDAEKEAWIIDDTVEALQSSARRIVREDARFARHRAALADAARMEAHAAFRHKVFLPPRPLSHYLDAMRAAGLRPMDVRTRAVRAKASEWHEFLAAYSDAVLGWVGGHEKVDGRAPSKEDLADRVTLMRLALDDVLAGRETFDATWTYVTCAKGARGA